MVIPVQSRLVFFCQKRVVRVPRSKSIEVIAEKRTQQKIEEASIENPDLTVDKEFEEATYDQFLEEIARERTKRFLQLASPQAQRLIMLLAAAPVITLPIVRLIRDAMLYGAKSPLPVAEVFLCGLIQRIRDQQSEQELKQAFAEENTNVLIGRKRTIILPKIAKTKK